MRFASTICFLAVLFLAFFTAPQALASNSAGDSPSLCCPSDLDGDGVVGSSDLADILAAWGPASAGDAADLDASGEIDAIDIAILIGSWGGCPAPCLKTLVIGSVQLADGTPVADAVIVTELGGQGVSDAAGAFSFEVELLSATESLTVTAIASLEGTTFTGTKMVSPITLDGVTDAGVISITASTGCAGEFGWLPGFGLPGLNGTVHAMAVFDDGLGGGPALYVGGDFTEAAGLKANYIARWDGSEWSALLEGNANGVDSFVTSLMVFDDNSGSGPALFVGGNFLTAGETLASGIAKWNGASWTSLGLGGANGVDAPIYALTVFDDGGGSKLYAGGAFVMAGGIEANGVARWDGISWSSLDAGGATGVNGTVYALAGRSVGLLGGPELFVAGQFMSAGGMVANRIARWDGEAWSSLGNGAANGVSGSVYALAFSDGLQAETPKLYVGGAFVHAGGVVRTRLARWDGASWSSVGTGSANGLNGPVRALAMLDDGSSDGPLLYVGGEFPSAGGVPAQHVARWDGTSWSSLGSGPNNGVNGPVWALASFDDGSGAGPVVFVGGGFVVAGGKSANFIAQWAGASLSAVGTGPTNGTPSSVYSLAVFDDGLGGGPALYAGGTFTVIGGVSANRIARWDGMSWSPLGVGSLNGVEGGAVSAMTVVDEGLGGPALYVAGGFTSAGEIAANRVARWSSGEWSSLGSGAQNGTNGGILALEVLRDSDGAAVELYAGGDFTIAGGVSANGIARWNGVSWSSLGVGEENGVSGRVHDLALFDDHSGRGLLVFVGGEFNSAGGILANRVAAWNGLTWAPLGEGPANGVNDLVYALAVYDDGSDRGPELYAGGAFTMAGGVPANRIAKWNGRSWSQLGTITLNGVNDPVYTLTVLDEGGDAGSSLYVGGLFTYTGGGPANRIARWDGRSWSSIGSGASNGLNGTVRAVAALDSLSGLGWTLYAGGSFTSAGGRPSHNIAAWGCTASRGD
jgi:trimeric autotransporter adhesin